MMTTLPSTCPACGGENESYYAPGGPVEQDGCNFVIKCKHCGFGYIKVMEGKHEKTGTV
jgi:hypothetical protein